MLGTRQPFRDLLSLLLVVCVFSRTFHVEATGEPSCRVVTAARLHRRIHIGYSKGVC